MASPCDMCNRSCCNSLVITVTSFDVERIAKHATLKPWQFAQLRKLDLETYHNNHVVECWDGKEREDYMLALKSLPCKLRSEDGCSVYEARPFSCRLYPHWKTGQISKNAVCPFVPKMMFGMGKPNLLHVEHFEKENLEFSGIVRECNRRKLTREKAFEFLTQVRIY